MTKALGSLQQVWKQPEIYKTAADAAVVQVQDPKRQLFRYKYQKRYEAALSRFDTPIRCGVYAGYTPREMFAANRNTPFRRGVRNTRSNLKNCKSKGLLSRSSVKLNRAYRNKHIQPVSQSAIQLKPCQTPVQRRRVVATPVAIPCTPRVATPRAPRRVATPRAAAPRTVPAGGDFHIWDHFTHVGTQGACKNGSTKMTVRCNYCGVQMAYCSRDGPGNHKAHIKTQACLAARGAPVQARAVGPECATKVKSKCKEPCQWKQGSQRKFCSKRGRMRAVAAPAPAPVAAAAPRRRRASPVAVVAAPVAVVAAPRRRRKSVARTAVGLCAKKTQPNCVAPCRWNNGPMRQFCTKGVALRNAAAHEDAVCVDLLQSYNISDEGDLNQWLSANANADAELKQRVINCGVRFFSS